jgi:NAD-dependent DNA ligase
MIFSTNREEPYYLMSMQASVIHENIPFLLNFEKMSSIVAQFQKWSPLHSKAFGNIPEYRSKRDNRSAIITIVSGSDECGEDDIFSPEGEETLSMVSRSPKRVPVPRKVSAHILEYWAERKKNPLTTLRDAEVCITGDLSSLEREEALSIVAHLGGTPKRSVTRTLDFLVVGTDAGSNKVFNAEKNIQDGAHLRMITETDFLGLIKHSQEAQQT